MAKRGDQAEPRRLKRHLDWLRINMPNSRIEQRAKIALTHQLARYSSDLPIRVSGEAPKSDGQRTMEKSGHKARSLRPNDP